MLVGKKFALQTFQDHQSFVKSSSKVRSNIALDTFGHLKLSVTGWLDYIFSIWPFTTLKLCPLAEGVYSVRPDLAKFNHFDKNFEVFGYLLRVVFCIWQILEPTLVICYDV